MITYCLKYRDYGQVRFSKTGKPTTTPVNYDLMQIKD